MIDKHELIDKIEKLDKVYGDRLYIEKDEVLALVKQLNEPQKVTIPQFVADWIEYCKINKICLGHALYCSGEAKDKRVYRWIVESLDNQDIFAQAWIFGYDIQGTKYVVTDGNHLYFKNYQEDIEIVILADEQPGTMDYVKKFDTKEEAQEAANILGWKVREVE